MMGGLEILAVFFFGLALGAALPTAYALLVILAAFVIKQFLDERKIRS